jgi:hypothetical protein
MFWCESKLCNRDFNKLLDDNIATKERSTIKNLGRNNFFHKSWVNVEEMKNCFWRSSSGDSGWWGIVPTAGSELG